MSEETTPEWVAQLPEALRSAPFIAKAETPEAAFTAIQNAANFRGRAVMFPDDDASPEARQEFYDKVLAKSPDLFQLPPPDATPEALEAFNKRLGVPEKADDYTPAEVEDWEWSDDYLANLREQALKSGMTRDQFKAFTQQLALGQMDADEATRLEIDEAQQALKSEWGAAFDARMGQIRTWLKQSNAPESLLALAADGNINPDAAKWLHEVAKQFTDTSNTVSDDGTEQPAPMTPLEAQDKISQIMDDPAYFDASSPKHESLKRRMFELQQMVADARA